MALVGGAWIGIKLLPLLWRDRAYFERMRDVLRIVGEPWATALTAAGAVVVPLIVVIGLLQLVAITREWSSGAVRSASEAVAYVLVIPFSGLMLLMFSVILFGRPKFLIPPHGRSHHGVVGEAVPWLVRGAARLVTRVRPRT